jgi:hypothetical protein
MRTGPQAPGDRHRGNGQRAAAAGPPGGDPAQHAAGEAGRVLALVLRRFRDYAHGTGDLTSGREGQHEEDR